jgi:hypothetical protein
MLSCVRSVTQAVEMLYLVGLGLSDETDITVKGLEVVKKASRVYLEAYTSILLVDQPVLVSQDRASSWLPRDLQQIKG